MDTTNMPQNISGSSRTLSNPPISIIRKDPNKIFREKFAKFLYKCLTETAPFTAEDKKSYNLAKESLPFKGSLPKFQLQVSSNILYTSIAGNVRTTAMPIYCDQ
jgi:hypothetical protein